MVRLLTIAFLLLIYPSNSHADRLTIKAEPIIQFKTGSADTRFGKLEFLGGLILTSDHKEFGGISALRFVKGSNFIAVTDKARVITGSLERMEGKPQKIKDERITRIKASNGKTITGARDKDAEAIEFSGNSFFVGYERNDRIMRFRLRGRKLVADAGYLVDLNPLEFPENKGPEAIAFQESSGKLFAFAEYALNSDGNHRGFLISGGKVEREIKIAARDGFSLTDAAFLPGGDLLLLERYFNPFTGVFMRMRRIASSNLGSENVIDGEIIIDVDDEHVIDNMEGLAVTEMADGGTRLTLISDDNFSRNQRTILLEFRLVN